MFIAPVLFSLALGAPPNETDDGARLYQWAKQATQVVQKTEFMQMLSAIRSGNMMGGNSGWFKPGENRYGWAWLAERYDTKKTGRISRKDFAGPPDLFQRLDRDRDGFITQSDLDWSESSPYWRQLSQATQLLRMLDGQDDRRITKEEWDKLFQKLAQGKDYLNNDDIRAMLYPVQPPPPPGAPKPNPMAGMPSKAMLLHGLINGELGSAAPGPRIGDRAPDFTLTDLDGKTVSLSQFRNKKPVVLIFGSFT